jgi:predicted Zn-dependent protease
MSAFFERLQKNGRLYENNAPAYLRTHPLTGERISEMESRVMQMPYRQVPDSLDFQLVRAKLQVGAVAPREVLEAFERAAAVASPTLAAQYGLVRAYLSTRRLDDAERAMEVLRKRRVASPMIAGLEAELRLAHRDPVGAAKAFREARLRFPQARRLLHGELEALLEAGRAGEALELAKAETLNSPTSAGLWELRARAESALGRRLAQHRSLAEVYAIQGNYAESVNQLALARTAGDGDFFEQSAVDSRLREVRVLLEEQRREMREQR